MTTLAAETLAPPENAGRVLRAGLYRLLAGCFLEPPTQERLAVLADPGTADAAESLLGPAVAEPLRSLAEAAPDVAALRQEFFDILSVPTQRYVSPFEAVYCDERDVAGRPARGLLGGPSTAAVRRAYERAGVRVEVRELPDHVACELAFLAELWDRAEDGPQAADAIAIFASAHPARWLPALADRIAEEAASPVYPCLARCAAALVGTDAARCAR